MKNNNILFYAVISVLLWFLYIFYFSRPLPEVLLLALTMIGLCLMALEINKIAKYYKKEYDMQIIKIAMLERTIEERKKKKRKNGKYDQL